MFLEVVFGILLALGWLYLFYLYLGWADNWSGKQAMYLAKPAAVLQNDKDYLDNYGWALPPEPVSDTYRYTNFWIQYYLSRSTV